MKKWMIYGANGYSAGLILKESIKKGIKPTLGGRDKAKITEIAEQYGLEYEIFSCDDSNAAHTLNDYYLVLNCAGPFRDTAEPILEACIASQTNYLDITGEIKVFEKIFAQAERIENAGIVAIPGVGFDVVPTDCLSSMLKHRLPDATHLTLVIESSGDLSPGTTLTMLGEVFHGTVERKDGEIKVSETFEFNEIQIGGEILSVVAIPWGDISTAYRTTQIPNIKVYMRSNDANKERLQKVEKHKGVIGSKIGQWVAKKWVKKNVSGPDEEQREKNKVQIYGIAENEQGRKLTMGLRAGDPYDFTAMSAFASVQHLIQKPLKPGVYTPSQAFNENFVVTVPGVRLLGH